MKLNYLKFGQQYLMASNNRSCPWTAVVVTCCSLEWATAIKSELELLRKKGIFPRDTYLLSVEDPEVKVGSGGATLNALLSVVEHISSKRGYTVLTANVLFDSRILVIHNGRSSIYAPCGKAFLHVPSCEPGCSKTNLESLVDMVNNLAVDLSNRYGVWVCSTDWLLGGQLPSALPSALMSSPADCLVFCALGSEEEGVQHGVVKLGDDCNVRSIHYRQSIDVVRDCKLESHNGRVPLVLGIVYISPELAESLASLHSHMEIISCTHLGVDSGSEPIQVSLYFDILAAIASDVSEDEFVAGSCGEIYGRHNDYRKSSTCMKQRFRRLVWEGLKHYRCQAVLLPDVDYVYLWDNMSMSNYLKCLKTHSSLQNVTTNSCVEGLQFESTASSLLENCVLVGNRDWPVIIESNVIASGLNINAVNLGRKINFKKDMVYLQFHCRNDASGNPESVPVIFGTKDELFLSSSNSKSTFCNRSWEAFFKATGIQRNEVWPIPTDEDSLFNAAIFPVGVEFIEMFEWIENPQTTPNWWSKKRRASLREILNSIDLKTEFSQRRLVSMNRGFQLSRQVLVDGQEGTLISTFKRATLEGWHTNLLEVLDEMAVGIYNSADHLSNITRILANIADLLDCIADGEGGVRSGPAANKDWAPALALFEKDDENGIQNGTRSLKIIRDTCNWMSDPRRIIRAARHYEGAVQALIRRNVLTANSFICLNDKPLPATDVWVVCECPARVDLFGGWTDTPPICYDLGGSVVNAAILVNGKRPIGSKVKRISDPVIIIHLDDGSMLRLSDLDHLSDYNQPLSRGALVKACLLCASIAEVGIDEALEKQLDRKYKSGFEIVTWSDLPKGSGLGTSSILAAAIIACLWTAAGKSYNRSSVIHAVLCVEQMLTTGGGWQDQVGGLTGGVAHGQSHPGLPLQVNVRRLHLQPQFLKVFRSRLILIYTGKVRLAKNLLQEVLRNWFARDSTIYGTFLSLYDSSFDFVKSLEQEDLARVGQLMNEYWRLKKILAAGAEPPAVERVMKELQPLVHGQLLCGAGGGGFMVALSKEGVTRQQLEDSLHRAQAGGMKIYEVDVDEEGLRVTVGDEKLEIE